MSFDFSKSINRERTIATEISFEDMDGVLPLTYYPGRLKETLEALQAAQESDDPETALKQLFLNLIASWGVVNNGEPVPLTLEGLASIKEYFQNWRITQIIYAIGQEQYLGEAKGKRLRKLL